MKDLERCGFFADSRVLLAAVFAAALVAFFGPIAAYDLWWHLKAGGLIAASGRVPTADPFSFTAAGQPWTYHSWLAGVLMSGLWRAAGERGIIAMRALLIGVSLCLSWALARRRGVGPALGAVLVLAAVLQLKVRALARPYLFSFVLFMVFAWLLQTAFQKPIAPLAKRVHRSRRGSRWLALEDAFLWGPGGRLLLLPVLMVLWANLHAGFASGFLLLGAFGVGEIVRVASRSGVRRCPRLLLKGREGARFRAMFVVGVVCLAGAVVTPHGPEALLYPFRLLGSVRLVKRIKEWQPMPLTVEFALFWALLVVTAVGLLRCAHAAVKAGRMRSEAGQLAVDGLLMGGFAVLALQSVRHMAWFLLLMPAVVGWFLEAADRPPGGEEPAPPAPRVIYVVGAWLLVVFVGLWPLASGGLPRWGPVRNKFPSGACDFIRENKLDLRFYNTYEWGGFLIWRLWPEQRVFIDGRSLLYGDRLIGQALTVEEGREGWEGVLKKWDVGLLIVRYRKRDGTHFFAGDDWRCVYWDDAALVAVRHSLYEEQREDLPALEKSNPVVFEQRLSASAAPAMLSELRTVLARNPRCWTALAYRARCLVQLARREPERSEQLLGEALDAARRALELQEEHADPWRALREAAEAAGDTALATRAARRLRELR